MEKNENLVAAATYLGVYISNTEKKSFNPETGEETSSTVSRTKYRYSLEFMTPEMQNAFIESNSSNNYTPLQADGSIVVQQNNMLPGGIPEEGHVCLAKLAITKDGKVILLTKDELDIHFEAERSRKVESISSPTLRDKTAEQLASSIKEEDLEARDLKKELIAKRDAANAALLVAFKAKPKDAKASKDAKLDVK